MAEAHAKERDDLRRQLDESRALELRALRAMEEERQAKGVAVAERDAAREQAAGAEARAERLAVALRGVLAWLDLAATMIPVGCIDSAARARIGEPACDAADAALALPASGALAEHDAALLAKAAGEMLAEAASIWTMVKAAREVRDWAGCVNPKAALTRCDAGSELDRDQWCCLCRLRAALAAYDKEPTP